MNAIPQPLLTTGISFLVAYAVLTANQYEMRVVQDMWPKIRFHAKREHAGLQLEAAA